MVAFNIDKDIPSLAGKVILITGGTEGLGKESVHQLAKHSPSHIYVTARSQTKADATLKELNDRNPDHAPITFLDMDLSSFDSIKAFAQNFTGTVSRLDLLICNAGLVNKGLTKEGYELAWGVNHMGHALLVQLLLPLLLQTSIDHPNADVRVVVVASDAEMFGPKQYMFEKTKTELPELWPMARYGQSKLANIHYAKMLAQKYPEATSGIKFVSIHPGAVYTKIGHEAFERFKFLESVVKRILTVLIGMVKVEDGVKSQLWAATADRSLVKEGEFYVPVAVTGKGTDKVRNAKMAEELWDYTVRELQPHLSEASAKIQR